MKKSCFFLLIVTAVFAASLTVVSCKKSDSQSPENSVTDDAGKVKGSKKSGNAAGYAGTPFNADSYSEEAPVYKERNALKLSTDSSNYVDYDSVNKFFALDYTPEYPDSIFTDAAQNQKKSGKKASKNSDKNEESQSVIPGIRKLSDYVTKYVTKKATLQDYKPNDEAEEDDTTKEFFVEDWGPQGKIVGGENHPTFYVIFSRPVRSLQGLDKPQTTSDIMSIEPNLPGTFRWYGTKHLSFESDLPADPTVR